MITIVSAGFLGLLTPLLIFDLAARPTLRRIALRNVTRRPGEAALVVGGTLLATALITASFIIGDSFGASIRDIAPKRWGTIDEVINVADIDQQKAAVAAATGVDPALVDGVAPVTLMNVAVRSPASGQSEPSIRVLEIDVESAATFSPDESVAELGDRDSSVLVSQVLADTLDVDPGDKIVLNVGGAEAQFEVVGVRAEGGLVGFGDVVVSTGSLTKIAELPKQGIVRSVLVSNTGDAFDGVAKTGDVVNVLRNELGDEANIATVKANLLDYAEDEAAEMTELFGTIGGFSVAAAILLVINLFVMLATERKSEMGVMRATGLQRGHLVRSLSLEGMLYGLVAAVFGVATGVGVAAVVMRMARSLFEGSHVVSLSVSSSSLISGAVIGLAVSQLTVLATSWGMTRLNIVAAIRDMPNPHKPPRTKLRLASAGVALAASGLTLWLFPEVQPVLLIMPVVALIACVPLLSRFVSQRIAVLIAICIAMTYAATVFGLMPDRMAEPEIFMFLIQGILLVGMASVVLAVGDNLWRSVAGKTAGGDIATRIGLAQPLSRPGRTALLVAMYALVIFTVAFMAVFNAVFSAQASEFAANAGGGYDVVVDTNLTSAGSDDWLSAYADVASVAPIRRGWVTVGGEDVANNGSDRRISGIDSSFSTVGPPPLSAKLDQFGSELEAWNAVNGGLYLIADSDEGFELGERVEFVGDNGASESLIVAGLTDQTWQVRAGLMVADDVARSLLGEDFPVNGHYLAVEPGVAPDDLAALIDAEGAERGARAQSFLDAARTEIEEQTGFVTLLQSYLGLGLLIGIAGLGVVLLRAVRERRQQFGVLRAIGVDRSVIRRCFVVESLFVAVQGITVGIVLGLIVSWQVLTKSSTFEEGLDFVLPTWPLAIIATSCLVASIAMAAVPAVRAARVPPAEALRVTS